MKVQMIPLPPPPEPDVVTVTLTKEEVRDLLKVFGPRDAGQVGHDTTDRLFRALLPVFPGHSY